MIKRERFVKAYELLNDVTPLSVDCGQLCNGACCHSADENTGMYLYPGEEQMLTEQSAWLHIKPSSFPYGNKKTAAVALCNSSCDRSFRPLACRIFPLTPYIRHYGTIDIIIDPRAVPVCPLAKPYMSQHLDKRFITAVTRVFSMLSKEKELYSFIYSISRLIDEQEDLRLQFTGRQESKQGKRKLYR